jgi:hypothetical protein
MPLAISLVAILVAIGAVAFPYWRRPSLSLREDTEHTHSRVEGDEIPYLRLLVRNAKGKRSAKHARVVLDGYRGAESRDPFTRLGSPFLGWSSVSGQDSDSYVSMVLLGCSPRRSWPVQERPSGRRRRPARAPGTLQAGPRGGERRGDERGGPGPSFPDAPDARWQPAS